VRVFNVLGFLRITLKRKIRIEPRREWIVFLIHEITHQFVFQKRGTTEHDKSFYVVNKHLLKKYVDPVLKHFDEETGEFTPENYEL
jgi:predicted SprT family Zn-dependent metalloprotease